MTIDDAVRAPETDTLNEELRVALRKVPASVAIITAGTLGACFGMTATAVTSVSLSPPAMLVCVYRAARMNAALRGNGRFRISYLRREQEHVACAFAGAASAETRFSIGDWEFGGRNGPRLRDALVDMVCRLDDSVDCGTHTIFIGSVEDVKTRAGEPLLYCNGLYGGLAV